ncbi:MAG: cytochrome c5 family protein [Gammaproteobacteria bacterium]|nr:cytochrome c5 family protein [Gammaproteobacteria bacterium]MDE2346685.1 cytochrome c5 family protein [Gammaproteobacteria bacterium]
METHDHQQHSDRHDQHFYDSFLLVIGILVIFAIGAYWLATDIAEHDPGAYNRGGAVQEKLIDERLAPVGDVQVAGSAGALPPAPAAAPAAGASHAKAESGKQIWEGTCSACHATGMIGAPKIGDRAAWKPRLAEGLKTLESHALHGYKAMPPHGGNMSLSDQQVIAALEYMISQSGGAGLVHK